ncbi:phenylalanine--tRNA ligase subunit beta [Candidatus Falkowbacteria bacterium RIFOXYB2_FULL_47_14]|uniref:Phenylalanine--tRNA ligase beta subunit n=1 Tax=Candidatus Falkowbacteria bacterium RIFOXYA2_FULL_47_19 TaxID=1797994 RepID=A0A1F5SHQ5_9BACT|nr:MAG: phenylalanine--tRNA ligase subunit beta [Candidatus Falkowbacteria bacterium RIFOXYA2_FULL_47_19]OGF36720.1 MAG: phenylalanine--tRNA ligase subunit beta [Candidatus Falkowbacteria bacterium RIFOXYC2_FULL_46_15]OGF42453.1 MAG: phenylalanine--tRNA ligase subunit beta [Candidatus Falkowbacteria bacterium RIFOXYB2_FULL_47_14]
MYLSLNWLKDFVDIPRSLAPEELARRLTMHTVEVESVVKEADKFKNIVVGEILEVRKHPQADKLQLARVRLKNEILDIVCGAPNIAVGQKVPVALVGAVLPNGLEIKEALIRGERSSGMLCALDELGLGDDHSGIFILDKKAKLSQNLAEYLKLKDVILEVDNKSLTNRPDLWGHFGMAREISVFLGRKFKEPGAITADKNESGTAIDVRIDDHGLCPRYMAVAMDNIKIGPSPRWMQERLAAVGTRPINNIVDITNYVMLEYGQPMHAFDGNLLSGSGKGYKITVRRANKGESIKTLDGEKRLLDEQMLLITDGNDPVAIAGVMGGETSEISDNTASIVFESANFNFVSVRRTSAKLGLRTESSVRFEKSLDPNLCETALFRAIELTRKICPGSKVISRIADEKKFALNQGPIKLDLDWVNRFIGLDIDKRKARKILERLGFAFVVDPAAGNRRDNALSVMIPSWRATKDIASKEDLAEEIIRVYGYDNLVSDMPEVKITVPETDRERLWEREIKNVLSMGGCLAEVYNYSFVGEEQLKKLGADRKDYLTLANPVSRDMTLLRQDLAPNLILNVRTNQARHDQFGLFEIGSVYFSHEGELPKDDKNVANLPHQEKRLGIVYAGKEDNVFVEVKTIIDYLLSYFNLKCDFNAAETMCDWADKAAIARVRANGKDIGKVYKLDQTAGKRSGIKKEVAIAEINLRELFKCLAGGGEKKYHPLDKYPSLNRDLAFIVDERVLFFDIANTILGFNEYIKEVELFDTYHDGEKLGKNRKNMAFHITYRADDRTLTSEEADGIQKALIKKLEEKFEAKVRDF